jgi:hypothetical protein
MKNRRKTVDRRANDYKQDRLFGCNRRYRADRRLNSIKVEWIPIDNIMAHPVTRLVFSRD